MTTTKYSIHQVTHLGKATYPQETPILARQVNLCGRTAVQGHYILYALLFLSAISSAYNAMTLPFPFLGAFHFMQNRCLIKWNRASFFPQFHGEIGRTFDTTQSTIALPKRPILVKDCAKAAEIFMSTAA